MNSSKDFHLEFECAQEIVKQAGDLLQEYADKGTEIVKHGTHSLSDLSTEADGAVENFIRSHLEKKFPDHGFIGEEGEASEGEQAWIVDPLDGTMAFSRQIPEYGIALAFKSGEEVIFSVQYIPVFEVLLTAYKGEGAFCNGERIQVGEVTSYDKTVLSIGYQNIWREKFREHTLSLLEGNHAFRIGHSSVVESYYFAAGKTDVLFRFEQKLWDTAAECLLMMEAGGVVTNEYGEPLSYTFSKEGLHNFVVTNPSLAESAARTIYHQR